jgi:hypothetical protein
LAPVRPVQIWHGAAAAALLVLALSAAVALFYGVRGDIAALAPADIVLVRSAALLLAGVATAHAALSSTRPGVGQRAQGWPWAVAAAALFPLAGLITWLRGDYALSDMVGPSVPYCFGISLGCAALLAGALTLWLRRGAVMEPQRAGLLIGLTSGALGTLAYNIACPSNSIGYAAIWYSLCVAISAIAGRMILPRFLRW